MEQNTQKDNNSITRTEAKNMMLETKVEIAKWQISIMLFLFVVLGMVYPIWNTYKQTEKVDKQIESMEERFKELAGLQLRKPDIICKVNNDPLLNNVIFPTEDYLSRELFLIDSYIDIQNIGDGIAKPIRVYLYLNTIDFDHVSSKEKYDHSEDTKYPAKYLIARVEDLLPQEVMNVPISVQIRETQHKELGAKLVVYYGETKPIEVPFTLKFVKP